MEPRGGVVIFFDLAGYSRQAIPVQEQLGNAFMQALKEAVMDLYPDTTPQRDADCPYLILPTGDGAAVVLWRQAQGHPRVEFTAIWLGGKMLTWAQYGEHQIGIRCGINAGLLEAVTDPYGSFNVCGAPINDAQRIMDAAANGQMLVHADHVAMRLNPADETALAMFRYKLHPEPHEILVKHGRTLSVRTITGAFRLPGGDQEFGTRDEPAGKWYLQVTPPVVEYNAYGIPIKRPVADMLIEQQCLAFVGATHDQLPLAFREAIAAKPAQRWQRITFFFLEDESLAWIRSDGRSHADLVAAKRQAREALERVLRDRVHELAFREYRFPFFFGAFFDWEMPGGKIHVSPYIWGLNVRECPGLDYEWRTQRPTDDYQYYRRGLAELAKDAWSHPYPLA